ncbi:MAG: RluA family pseudouridine synthase [Pirellulales bacterium]
MPTEFPFTVLYEDNHLLVVDKPALLPTMGVAAGKLSLLDACKQYVREKYRKPGNVYLGVVSRLDAPVTGVLLIARTSKAAARLTEAFRAREVEKSYWAFVAAEVRFRGYAEDWTTLDDWLYKDERHRRMHVGSLHSPAAQHAQLRYRRLESYPEGDLLEVELLTGRKHQIRLQLAHHGLPIVGDRKYGSRIEFAPGIALHSRRLSLMHPVRKERMEFVAPLPKSWARFVTRL